MAKVPGKDAKEPKASLQDRFGKIMHITTRSGEGKDGSGSASGGPRKAIQTVPDFHDLYDLGKEVMPSTHSYMKVNFATRKADGLDCVVKLRFKPGCFRSRDDERNWRYNTEFLLNMPDNSGVARIYEVLEDSKAFYIVMERVSGMDLFETLEQMGKVPVDMAREILRQLLQSLAHLHSHNAVHKDLKLENVMLDATPKGIGSPSVSPRSVKVIDFDTLEEWTPRSPTARDVVGTDQYIAQEAYAGKYSPLSDIFAAGVIAYRLLSGRFPFHDETFDDEAGENWVGSPKMSQIRRRLKVAKVDFSHAVFRENPQACDLVMRMLSYNESARPTAAVALEHPWFLEGEGPLGADASPSATARRNSTRSLVALRGDEHDLIDDGVIIAEDD